ncbi:hypothetical protein K7432_011441 [Basidiobolus ranarum]|uniref:Uncharacterized protein n=1 Tax=Basidiobolus ranarum TaxID=34480 RepID=A0ABR2WMB2_9FUNG
MCRLLERAQEKSASHHLKMEIPKYVYLCTANKKLVPADFAFQSLVDIDPFYIGWKFMVWSSSDALCCFLSHLG